MTTADALGGVLETTVAECSGGVDGGVGVLGPVVVEAVVAAVGVPGGELALALQPAVVNMARPTTAHTAGLPRLFIRATSRFYM